MVVVDICRPAILGVRCDKCFTYGELLSTLTLQVRSQVRSVERSLRIPPKAASSLGTLPITSGLLVQRRFMGC